MNLASLKSTSVGVKTGLIKKCAEVLRQHVIVAAEGDSLLSALEMLEDLELVEETMMRLGEGVGEDIEAALSNDSREPGRSIQSIAQKLDDTHYLTDGLTLPVEEAIHSIEEVLRGGEWGEVASFLENHSNLALSLRIISNSKVGQIDKAAKDQLLQKLASRCLHHSTIDVDLSTAYLLLLSQKAAFKIYRNALPPAMSSLAYDRVFVLSEIGIRAAEVWGNQADFHKQCMRLKKNAKWWGVMKRRSVAFEPKKFEGEDKDIVDYAQGLVMSLTEKCGQVMGR